MSIIYLLYVYNDTLVDHVGYPNYINFNNPRYSMLWIGSTESCDTSHVIYDKRSSYTKFKKRDRYHRDFMELFKYVEETELKIGVYVLETNVVKTNLNDRLTEHNFLYRTYYGSKLILTDDTLISSVDRFRDTLLRKAQDRPRLVFDSSVPLAERQSLSRKKYDDRNRTALREKSRQYYAVHRDELKAKRDLKKVSNVEQPETEVDQPETEVEQPLVN